MKLELKKKIIEIAAAGREKYVGNRPPLGHCGRCSDKLLEDFKVVDIVATKVHGGVHCPKDGYGHTWLEIENYIVDITGDQFNHSMMRPLPPVMVRHKRYLEKLYKSF